MFLLSFTLAPVFAGLAGVLILIAGDGAAGGLLLAAAAVYLVGVIGVTGGLNVPLNNTLDAATPSGPDQAAEVWAAYSPPWTRWNHVRTVANTASLLLTGLAIYVCGS